MTTRQKVAALDRTATAAVIGGARIAVGLMWLANLHWKVPPDFGEDNGGGLFKYSESVTRNSPFAPFTWVTEEIILPNFTLFGWFTLVVETIVAALLLVGYRTRVVALLGAALTVPIFLSVLYYDRADEWSWAYILMFVAHLLLWATDAGRHGGLDGALRHGPGAASRGLLATGVVATAVGVAGLWVARSIDVIGSEAKLLGSDAGFVNADGGITRRWELKLMWFTPSWALLTILFGVALIVGSRVRPAAIVGGVGFAVIAAVVGATRTFDYLRDDGAVQVVSTASNVAVWAGFALVGILLGRRPAVDTVADATIDTDTDTDADTAMIDTA
jgi:thiosulfate dehydrogenase [quinone] large subunit